MLKNTASPHKFRGRMLGGVRAEPNVAVILADLTKTFEDFKAERTKEMDDLRKDVVQSEKVDRINDEVTRLNSELTTAQQTLAALRVGGAAEADGPSAEAQEHKAAFDKFFRKGVDAGLGDLQVKAKLTTDSDPDGGYLVPEETESTIDRVLGTVSTVRSLARTMPISTDTYKKLVGMGGASSGWVAEKGARPETNTPALREIVLNTHELYAMPAATQKSLDDARINVAEWLADEVSIEFAEQEGDAFVNGDGTNQPKGLLSYTNVANASYEWGKLGYIATKEAAAFKDPSSTVSPADCLIELYYALKSGYRNGASWLMSDAVMGTVRKFKDADGKFIWEPPTGKAEVATILGKPVHNDDNMPAVAAGKFPIAFGNFQRSYLIVDRMGIRVLRDPFTSKPNVLFYTTKSVGGGIVNFEAMKLLKVASS